MNSRILIALTIWFLYVYIYSYISLSNKRYGYFYALCAFEGIVLLLVCIVFQDTSHKLLINNGVAAHAFYTILTGGVLTIE